MATRKSSKSKRYGAKASEKVEQAIHEMKEGKLRSGGSGKKVTSRKQAIAIGLSEARAAGGKVPKAPVKKRAKKAAKATTKRSAKGRTAKRTTTRNSARKSSTKKR
jgi:hypothetical protein